MTKRNSIPFLTLMVATLCALQPAVAKGPPVAVTVTAADPNSGLQGESLPVIISGEGFDAGSSVRFLVSGTRDDSQILVHSVTFDADGTLTANIQVRDDAQVFEYDIEVRSASGRRGKGTSLFSVKSKNGDDSKGGFGDVGNGCVAFQPGGGEGTIHEDVDEAYCNGTDGQVSMPKRLRMDTKKFNSNERVYLVEATCAHSFCAGEREAEVFQSQLRYTWDDAVGALVPQEDDELDFQAMSIGEIARVSMSIAAGRKLRLKFGNEHGLRVQCPAGTAGEPTGGPLWARCEADDNGDGFCDLWTVTTLNLERVDDNDEPDARACLVNHHGKLLDGNVQADFILDVCVLGVSCP